MSTLSERIATNDDMPFEIRKAFMNAGEPTEEYRSQILLWRECVARAVMDAMGFTGQTEPDKHNAILKEAKRWWKYSPDVDEVFDNAEMPSRFTREVVIQNFALTKKNVRHKAADKKARKKH